MKALGEKPPSKVPALLLSILTVVLILALIVHGGELISTLAEYGIDLGKFTQKLASGELEVRVIDVGQGDAILVRTDDCTLLIDSGTSESEKALKAQLRTLGVRTIDCLVLTHPHEDHIGGADLILSKFRVGRIILADTDEDSIPLQELIKTAESRSVPIDDPQIGAKYLLGNLEFTLLAPLDDSDGNDSSLVLRLDHGDTSFLFAGDAEENSERLMLEAYKSGELDCDFLKLGHHGSSTSSNVEFLSAVTPEWAAITCGRGNEHGHPHREVIERLKSLGVDESHILRTDRDGTFRLISDGKTITCPNRSVQ